MNLDLPDWMFKNLNKKQEKLYRAWARQNWKPEQTIDPLWHPVVRDEIAIMVKEHEESRST